MTPSTTDPTMTETLPTPETHMLPDAPAIPNNPDLPVLVYRGALTGATASADGCRALFARNGWTEGGWVNGIFDYPHYHAQAHEVLGIVAGSARVRLGGDAGIETEIAAGDVVVLPAGTGHQNLGDSGDLRVVGSYPKGARVDLKDARTADPEAAKAEARAAIAAVPMPPADPVAGPDGPLMRHWATG